MTQSQALKILLAGHNVFLTGSAGTGKTFLLNKFIEKAKKRKLKVSVTASSGIAATHLSGRTVHSWSGMGIERDMDDKSIRKLFKKVDVWERIRETQVLIIDEISMLDAARLDLVDKICKTVRDPFLPFGGIQIVLSGDFFQLPPVDPDGNSLFAFDSDVWQEANTSVCYLDKQYRQDDFNFVNILNKIRGNQAGQKEMSLLKTRLHQLVDNVVKPTKLYTHNSNVDAINAYELSRIPGEEFVFEMTSRGPLDMIQTLKKGCMAQEFLKLKTGALVMFIKNNFDAGYVNGTLGTVIDFDEEGYPLIETIKGDRIIAMPESWNIENDYEIIAQIRQIPLRLAWAITVHKSQGMSLDAAEIDLSKSFERGMGYVALSRVRSLRGIRLMGINELSLQVSPFIIEKDKEFRKLSDQN